MEIVNHQNTKIVATVGPSSSSYNNLLELAKAGVDVFRLNFSHGEHNDHLKVINNISYINEKYKLIEALKSIKSVVKIYPSDANFLLVKFKEAHTWVH